MFILVWNVMEWVKSCSEISYTTPSNLRNMKKFINMLLHFRVSPTI